MAIFNNSDLFANPFGKTKSVSGSKNVQNPFGDQKIPNYMELFQFNDATKPIDFVELKDDKSSDKKSSNSTELTMEEDVSVKDKLSWEKILGVEWKRGKDTSVTQKDGEKIFESTVKNVVSGEERKIKTVIHKDKETCSTYMSVNGTPEGNPYSKLIQELKSMGESATAETANSAAETAGAPQNEDDNANVTEESETPVNNAAPDADDSAVTSDKDPAPTNQKAKEQNKTPAQGSDSTAETIKREETRIDANGKKIHITYNALPAEVDENYDPGEGWFQIEKDGQKYFKHEASGLVFDLVKSKYGDGTTLELSTGYYKGSKNTTETKAGATKTVGGRTCLIFNDKSVTYNTPPADKCDPNFNPGKGWEKLTLAGIWKHTTTGLYYKVIADKDNNTTNFVRDYTTYDSGSLKTPVTKGFWGDIKTRPNLGPNYKYSKVADNRGTSVTLEYIREDGNKYLIIFDKKGDKYIWNNTPLRFVGKTEDYEETKPNDAITFAKIPSGYHPNYNPGDGWEEKTSTINGKTVPVWKHQKTGMYYRVVADKKKNTTEFVRELKTYDPSGLQPINISWFGKLEGTPPNIGPNYNFVSLQPNDPEYKLLYKRRDGNFFIIRYIKNDGQCIWDGQAPQQITK